MVFFMVESLWILESWVVGARRLQAHSAPLQQAPGTQRWAWPGSPSHCQVCCLGTGSGGRKGLGFPQRRSDTARPWRPPAVLEQGLL